MKSFISLIVLFLISFALASLIPSLSATEATPNNSIEQKNLLLLIPKSEATGLQQVCIGGFGVSAVVV